MTLHCHLVYRPAKPDDVAFYEEHNENRRVSVITLQKYLYVYLKHIYM